LFLVEANMAGCLTVAGDSCCQGVWQALAARPTALRAGRADQGQGHRGL